MAKKGNIPWNKGIKTNTHSHNSLCLDKDELYGLRLKGKSKLYKAYFFLFTNPKLFILKILRKICPKKKNKTNKKASKMAPNNSSLIENEK